MARYARLAVRNPWLGPRLFFLVTASGFFAMLAGKGFARFARVLLGMRAMAVGEMSMMSALAGIVVLQVFSGFFMMLGCLLVMLGCFLVMFVMGAGSVVIHSHNYFLFDRDLRRRAE
jgi:hypothetical protein